MLIGNLGRDPELKYLANGTALIEFSVGVSTRFKDKEHTEWFNVTHFGEYSEKLAEWLAKGRQVYVEGRMQTDTFEKDGVKHYRTKVIAQTVQTLGASTGGGQGGKTYSQRASKPARQSRPAPDDLPFE